MTPTPAEIEVQVVTLIGEIARDYLKSRGFTKEDAEHFRGVTWCLLSTVAVLALLGLRYPLKMLPLLFFELIWKATWIIAIGLPLRSSGQLEGEFSETWFANVLGLVIVPLVIPWGYVVRTYIREAGDRWTPFW